jgi:hypothetical protein
VRVEIARCPYLFQRLRPRQVASRSIGGPAYWGRTLIPLLGSLEWRKHLSWQEWNSLISPDTTLSPHEFARTPWG